MYNNCSHLKRINHILILFSILENKMQADSTYTLIDINNFINYYWNYRHFFLQKMIYYFILIH